MVIIINISVIALKYSLFKLLTNSTRSLHFLTFGHIVYSKQINNDLKTFNAL